MSVVTGPAPSLAVQSSLHEAMVRGSLLGIAAFEAIPAWGVLTTDLRLPRLIVAAPHLALVVMALLAFRRPGRVTILLAALYATVLFDFAVLDEPMGALFFGAAWISYTAIATPALVLRGPAAAWFPAVSALAIATGTYAVHPEWGIDVPLAGLVAAATVTPAAAAFIAPLRRLAARADENADAAGRELERLAASRHAGRTSAELARTLHDTVVNTLGALADARHPQPEAMVRTRCAEDARRIESVIAGTRPDPLGVDSARSVPGILVRSTGMSRDELRSCEALVPEATRALRGAIGELVQNAAKHSGAEVVSIHTRRDGNELQVTVSDTGVGFVPDPRPGRGLAESVLHRCADAGVDVRIDSAPGDGTTVTMRCHLEPEPIDQAALALIDVPTTINRARRAACWRWAVCILGAELIMEAVNRRGVLGLGFGLLLGIVALCLLAWRVCRHRATAPGWLTVVLGAAVPCGFVLGFAGIGWGEDPLFMWQAISLSSLLVVLLVTSRSQVAPWLTLTCLTVTAAVMTVLVWTDRPLIAAVIPACFVLQVGQFAAWWVYDRTLVRLTARSAGLAAQAAAARAEQAAREADSRTRERWRRAGLDGALRLLRSVADGSLDSTDADVRARCGAEERHLRQLILLDPNLLRMGPWLTRALFEARARGVSLTIRSGSLDAPDVPTAEHLGRLLTDAVEMTPPGGTLTISLFDDGGRLHLTLVGAARSLDAGRIRAHEGLPVLATEVVGDQYIVEASTEPGALLALTAETVRSSSGCA